MITKPHIQFHFKTWTRDWPVGGISINLLSTLLCCPPTLVFESIIELSGIIVSACTETCCPQWRWDEYKAKQGYKSIISKKIQKDALFLAAKFPRAAFESNSFRDYYNIKDATASFKELMIAAVKLGVKTIPRKNTQLNDDSCRYCKGNWRRFK